MITFVFLVARAYGYSLRSAAKLSYGQAQEVIEGKHLSESTSSTDHDTLAIEQDIKLLHNLANALRTRRFQSGALYLGTLQLSFKLNESGVPVDCYQQERTAACNLVEEVRSSPFAILGQHCSLTDPIVHDFGQYYSCTTDSCQLA